jgi:hypothetical protein
LLKRHGGRESLPVEPAISIRGLVYFLHPIVTQHLQSPAEFRELFPVEDGFRFGTARHKQIFAYSPFVRHRIGLIQISRQFQASVSIMNQVRQGAENAGRGGTRLHPSKINKAENPDLQISVSIMDLGSDAIPAAERSETGGVAAPRNNKPRNRVFQISVSIMNSVRQGVKAKAKRLGGHSQALQEK